MGINLIAGQPNVVVAKQTISFDLAGITAINTAVIFLVSNGELKSYVPGRVINGITGFVKNKGYYIVPLVDMDLQNWSLPPIVRPSDGVPLIIFTGESNSGGYADNSLALPAEIAARPSVQIINNLTLAGFEDLNISVGNNIYGHAGAESWVGSRHGWELMLANRVEAGTFIPSPCYLVKTGQGASQIANWAVGGVYGSTNCWQTFQDRVDLAIDIITTNTGTPPTPYIFYSQGINDAIAGTDVETWKTATLAHFDKIRAKYGANTPIVMTKLTPPYPLFNAAIEEVAGQRSDTYFAETSDLPVQPDNNHWDYASMKILSSRMQDILLQNYAI